MNTSKIAIIGAGPTGIFTALLLSKHNIQIDLFEKNKDIGEKLKLTGGGRMNVTNNILTSEEFFSSTPRKKDHFFKTPHFKKVSNIFEELGVEYTWEKKRAILKSQNAKAEVNRLKEKIENQNNIKLHLSTDISNLKPVLQKYDFVICTTGGMFQVGSQPNKEKTYTLFETLGHSIVKPSPSLSPFRFTENPLKHLSGISFEGKLFSKNKSITDDILITHFGLSGPAVLDFSALWNGTDEIFVSFFPEESESSLLQKIKSLRNGKHKTVELFPHLPKRLSQFILDQSIPSSKKYLTDVNKIEEKKLIETLLHFPLPKPQLFPYPGCWTTKGGISLNEIHMHSLESKKVKNLYLGGEVIDIDGLCGGYHISLAALCAKVISKDISNKIIPPSSFRNSLKA